MTGQVRHWNQEKRYGKIAGDDRIEYFVHFSEVLDRHALTVGDSVTFRVVDRGRGPRAVDVRVVEVPAPTHR